MKAAIVRDGTVENTVNLPDDWSGSEGEWQPADEAEVVDATGTGAGPGWGYDGVEFTPPPSDEPEPTAAEIEMRCLDAIDQKASKVRDRFITAGIGQEATYLQKFEEATAYKKASSPTASNYPLLNAESARRGMTMTALADEVIARRNAWIDPAAAQVEAERVGGKDDVRAATTVADKESACDTAIATLDGIRPA